MRSDGHQELAFGRELGYRVYSIIGAEHRIVGPDEDAVRPVAEDTLAESSQEITVGVEDHHGVLFVAAEYIHLVPGVYRDARGLLKPCTFW